jgi:hypothetical protein
MLSMSHSQPRPTVEAISHHVCSATIRMLRRKIVQEIARHGPAVPVKVRADLLLEVCDAALMGRSE